MHWIAVFRFLETKQVEPGELLYNSGAPALMFSGDTQATMTFPVSWGTAASRIAMVWDPRKINTGNIPSITDSQVSARSDLILRSLIFLTNASAFRKGRCSGRLFGWLDVGNDSVVISKANR